MERFQFVTWAENYSQRTNRSLAGSQLRIERNGIDDAELLRAQNWGMTVSSGRRYL